MLDGKLRIAPTCYHVLHQVPVMTAHELNFFYDEGLKTADGSLGYEILTDSMVPFGLEKLGISQAMKEKSVDIALDVQSRTVFTSAPAAPIFTSYPAGAISTPMSGSRRRILSPSKN